MNGSDAEAGTHYVTALQALTYGTVVLLAIVFAIGWRTEALLEAWLVAFLVLAGLASASLGLLMIGHLLGETWLHPVRCPLEAAASTTPLVLFLALPLAVGADLLYPWAAGPIRGIAPERQLYLSESFVLVRGAVILVLWIAIAIPILRRGRHQKASAIGLALLAPTAAIFSIDWVGSREPVWWSSLFAFAYTVTQLAGAMALALVVAMLQQSYPDPARYHSLQRAAITLALLTFWVWFAQFLVVWMANLPAEVEWYLARSEGAWRWPMMAVALPSLLASIVLLLPSHPSRWRLVAAGLFLFVQYLAHMLWLVRPASAGMPALTWADPPVWLGLALLWAIWYMAARRVAQATIGLPPA